MNFKKLQQFCPCLYLDSPNFEFERGQSPCDGKACTLYKPFTIEDTDFEVNCIPQRLILIILVLSYDLSTRKKYTSFTTELFYEQIDLCANIIRIAKSIITMPSPNELFRFEMFKLTGYPESSDYWGNA